MQTLEETGSAGMESAKKEQALGGAGNVRLILNNETVLIPTPSPDPKGKSLNTGSKHCLTLI